MYSDFISAYMNICKDDIVERWGDKIIWGNSSEREIQLNIYTFPIHIYFKFPILQLQIKPRAYIDKFDC